MAKPIGTADAHGTHAYFPCSAPPSPPAPASAGAGRTRRPPGVRRRAVSEEEAAEHAADDPLEHRPSLGDVARVHSLRRRVAIAAHATPSSRTHGGAWLGERRAIAELRWGARANWESVAAAGAMPAHL